MVSVNPGGVNAADPDPPDMAAQLRAAWDLASPGRPPHEFRLADLPRVLVGVPGWPFRASDPRAPGLLAALTDLAADRVPIGAAERAPLETGVVRALDRHRADQPWSSSWSRLVSEAFQAAAVRQYQQDAREGVAYDFDRHGEGSDVVTGLVPGRQPFVVGGPEKAAKTLLTTALAAAVATGTAFLGRPTNGPARVAVLTLETPTSVWFDRLWAAARALGADPEAVADRVTISDGTEYLTHVPDRCGSTRQERLDERKGFLDFLSAAGVKLVVIDPLYLATPRVNAADIAAQGRALRHLCNPIIDAGATPALVHHFTKATGPGDVPTLRDLSGSAVGPFARGWLLVNRRTEYAGAGVHDLVALTGTAGSHAVLDVRVDERPDSWAVTARPHGDPAPDAEPVAEPRIVAAREAGDGGELYPSRRRRGR